MSDHHESPIKTPRQLITVVILAFAVPLSLIGLLVAYVTGGQQGAEAPQTRKPEAVAERIKPVAAVTLRDANAPKVFQTGEQVYKAICAACHDTGAANAPKLGDKARWAPLIKEGFDALLADAIKGTAKGMPPKGGNPDLEDVEVARAVAFMANASGAGFKEPAAPAASATPATPATQAKAAADAKSAAVPAAAAAVVVIPPPVVAAAAPSAGAKADVGKALYDAACQVCHVTGVANAPKFGDKAAWAPRLGAGIDTMTRTVITGKGAMPAKGTAMSASDADIKAAVVYMVNAAK